MSKQHHELILILERVHDLCAQSEDSFWSSDSADSLKSELSTAIQELREGKHISLERLNFLFSPTCSLQDTSMDNGWGDEFLKLAAGFDGIKARWEPS